MELLRGQVSDEEGDDAIARGGHAHDDDDTWNEPLPFAIGQAERRLQVRAYSFWAGLLGDRPFPLLSSLRPESLPDFGPHGVLLDFSRDAATPRIAFIGAALATECGTPADPGSLSEVSAGSLLWPITAHYKQMLTGQAPVGFEAEFVNPHGATVLYRGILLPFSSDGETLDHVFGVLNWKELADAQIAGELEAQIAQSLQPLRQLRLESGPPSYAFDPADGRAPRRARLRAEAAADTALPASLIARLRSMDTVSLDALGDGAEFTLLLARRREGQVRVLGEVPGASHLLADAARRVVG